MEKQETNTQDPPKLQEELLSPGNIKAANPASEQQDTESQRIIDRMNAIASQLGELVTFTAGRIRAFELVQKGYSDKPVPSIDVLLEGADKVYDWLTTGKWTRSEEAVPRESIRKKPGPKAGSKKKAKKPLLVPMPPKGKPGRKPAPKKR